MHINKITTINTAENPTEATDRILKGVNFICNAVKQTLGPWGRNFLLEKKLKITNDGISIAKEIQLKDEIEDLALRITREAAVKTNDEAGDGTTTALTLTQAILKEAMRLLPGKKLSGQKSAVQIRKQIAEECDFVAEELKKMATPVKTKEELINVAMVSSEMKELAEMIGTMQWELGTDGVIIPEMSNDIKDSMEKVKGIRFDNGFGTSLVMNNQEKQRLEVENVQVIMTNYTFQDLKPLQLILDQLVKNQKRDIIIIGRAFSQEAVRICMTNHQAGVRIYPINAPYVNQVEIMEDLASVLGGTFFNEEQRALEDMLISDIGFAKRALCYRFSAIFMGNEDKKNETIVKDRIKTRLEILRETLKGEESVFVKKQIEQRIAQLTNGFSIINIGALSETDRKYRYDKAEDAVNSVKSALQEGTVPGGGLSFKIISEKMPNDAILKRPLLSIYQQIMDNAGETIEIEEWVRDSVKVNRVALQNACQIAADLATACGAVANEFPKPKYIQEQNNKEYND